MSIITLRKSSTARGKSLSVRGIVLGVVAAATFTLLGARPWKDDGRSNSRIFSGVADPVASRSADRQPAASVEAMTPRKILFNINGVADSRRAITLCQALGPAAPYPICGVDCAECAASGRCCRGWEATRAIQWQAFAQGEYVGHARTEHVPEYRLRVDDQLDMIYRITRQEQPNPYRLNVGDEINVESFTDHQLDKNLLIQPDGTITLRLLGQVHATGRTVTQLRDSLDDMYKKYYRVPAITVTPLKVNTKLEDLRATVDRRAGVGGQSQYGARHARRHHFAAGYRLGARPRVDADRSCRLELNERYWQVVEGIEVIPGPGGTRPALTFMCWAK